MSQCKECASEFQIEFRRERAKRAHQDKYRLKEILRVTEYSGGRTVQRRHRGET
jgi:hypothetical protein